MCRLVCLASFVYQTVGTKMPKRVLDRFDLEAEREGNAIKGHTVIRRGWGKGITKQRNMHKKGSEILTTRIVNREGWLK